MTAYGRTVAGVGIAAILLAVVETLAFVTGWFVPITWTLIDAGNATPLPAFAWFFLGGHFYPPRPRSRRDRLRVALVYALVAAAAVVAWGLYRPASAGLAGYVAGGLFFPSADRRRREDGGLDRGLPMSALLLFVAASITACAYLPDIIIRPGPPGPACPPGDPITWCDCWSKTGHGGGEWVKAPPCTDCSRFGPVCKAGADCDCYYLSFRSCLLRKCPTPQPTSPPTPSPEPTTAPSPGPTPTPVPAVCGLPPGTGAGVNCPKTSPHYRTAVEAAIDKVLASRPDLFDGQGRLVSHEASLAYHAGVVAHLVAEGFCAFFDGEEIALKRTNAFSEQWDIESAGRRSIRLYTATCMPAWSAIPSGGQAPDPPDPPDPPQEPPCVPSDWQVDCRQACDDFWSELREKYSRPPYDPAYYPVRYLGQEVAIPHEHDVHPPIPPGQRWVPTPEQILVARRAVDKDCNIRQVPGLNLVHTTIPWQREFDADHTQTPPAPILDEQGDPIPVNYWGQLGQGRKFPCEVRKPVACAPQPQPDPPDTDPPHQPGASPPLACFGAALHSVITPQGTVSNDDAGRPAPCRGCRHALDSTPYFVRCGPNFRCNGEVHNVCSPEGDAHPQSAEHLAAEREQRPCRGFRRAEDPRGPVWRQLAGPPAFCEGGQRGFLCRLVLTQPGRYSFGVCAGGDFRDLDGVLNANQAACERAAVTFEVP